MRTIAVSLLLALSACVATDEDELPVELSDEALSPDAKADHYSLGFETFVDDVGEQGAEETRVVLTSAASYEAYFGHRAPAEVDFATEWVFFYSAGNRSTGGYTAAVDDITRSHSGKTLYFHTRLVSPGPGCVVTFALTRPHVLVTFAKPRVRPTRVVGYHDDEVTSCDRCEDRPLDSCGDDGRCQVVAEGCDPPPVDPDTGLPYPCDPIPVCRAITAGGEGASCGTRGQAPCGEGLFCNFPVSASCGAADHPGTCEVQPEVCIQVYEPVCGCDGQSYSNACVAAAAGISVAQAGACR